MKQTIVATTSTLRNVSPISSQQITALYTIFSEPSGAIMDTGAYASAATVNGWHPMYMTIPSMKLGWQYDGTCTFAAEF